MYKSILRPRNLGPVALASVLALVLGISARTEGQTNYLTAPINASVDLGSKKVILSSVVPAAGDNAKLAACGPDFWAQGVVYDPQNNRVLAQSEEYLGAISSGEFELRQSVDVSSVNGTKVVAKLGIINKCGGAEPAEFFWSDQSGEFTFQQTALPVLEN